MLGKSNSLKFSLTLCAFPLYFCTNIFFFETVCLCVCVELTESTGFQTVLRLHAMQIYIHNNNSCNVDNLPFRNSLFRSKQIEWVQWHEINAASSSDSKTTKYSHWHHQNNENILVHFIQNTQTLPTIHTHTLSKAYTAL